MTIFLLRDTDSNAKAKDSENKTQQEADTGADNNPSDDTSDTQDDDSTSDDNSTENNTDEEEEKSTHIKGEKKYGTLLLTIDQEESDEIVIHLENGNLEYKFGWTSDSQYIITTTSGKEIVAYSNNYVGLNDSRKITPNTSGKILLFFDSIDEPIEKLTIVHFCPLENNLPANNNSNGIMLEIDIEYVE